MKKLAFLSMAVIMCISTVATAAMYTFASQAQRLVDKELGELMVRLYLNSESAYLQQKEVEHYKDLIVVLPLHEWESIKHKIVWQNIYNVIWPTLCGSFYGALIGIAAGGALGLMTGCCMAQDFFRYVIQRAPVIGVLSCGFGFVYIIAGLAWGAIIGTVISGVVGFVCGLIRGIVKLFQEKRIERCDGPLALKDEALVAVRFPVLAHQLKQLAGDGVELYVQVDELGFSVI